MNSHARIPVHWCDVRPLKMSLRHMLDREFGRQHLPRRTVRWWWSSPQTDRGRKCKSNSEWLIHGRSITRLSDSLSIVGLMTELFSGFLILLFFFLKRLITWGKGEIARPTWYLLFLMDLPNKHERRRRKKKRGRESKISTNSAAKKVSGYDYSLLVNK